MAPTKAILERNRAQRSCPADRNGFHTVISRIAEGNAASIHMHEKLGFRHIGVMQEVGRKFGKLLDVHLMQKIFPGS